MNNTANMTDTEAKSVALMMLAENVGKEFSKTQVRLWLGLLANYRPEDVAAGVLRVIETHPYKHIPPFAVLKQAIDAVRGNDEAAIDLQAQAEWSALLEGFRTGAHSRYSPPKLHPTTAHVVRMMGGWDAVCDWPTHSFDFKRRDFLELWKNSHGKAHLLEQGASAVLSALTARAGGTLALMGTAQ